MSQPLAVTPLSWGETLALYAPDSLPADGSGNGAVNAQPLASGGQITNVPTYVAAGSGAAGGLWTHEVQAAVHAGASLFVRLHQTTYLDGVETGQQVIGDGVTPIQDYPFALNIDTPGVVTQVWVLDYVGGQQETRTVEFVVVPAV